MGKNYYLNLEKDDILFVNNGKENITLYLFDGTDFQELTTEAEGTLNDYDIKVINLDTDSIVAQETVEPSEVKQQVNMELEALKADVSMLIYEVSQLKDDNHVLKLNLGGRIL